MKVAVLFSGGKDSCFATWHALHQGWEVSTLVVVVSANPDSFMFHTPNITWTTLQAEAMGLPINKIYSQGIKELELTELREGLKQLLQNSDVTALLSGAIQSEYQKTRIDRICKSLHLKSIAPLWHKNPFKIIKEEVDLGFQFILSSCSAQGLGREWLGRKIDDNALQKLEGLVKKYGINPAFEGGEAETFVIDSPPFNKKILISQTEEDWHGDRGQLIIKKASLISK